jgi:hypothetical protein
MNNAQQVTSSLSDASQPVTGVPVSPSELSYVVISGGTGANSIATAFGSSPAFVLPVSDDGGSSAEILRCFGGPSIGDISQCPCTSVVTVLTPRVPSDTVDPFAGECAYESRAGAGSDIQLDVISISCRCSGEGSKGPMDGYSRGQELALGWYWRRQERVYSR